MAGMEEEWCVESEGEEEELSQGDCDGDDDGDDEAEMKALHDDDVDDADDDDEGLVDVGQEMARRGTDQSATKFRVVNGKSLISEQLRLLSQVAEFLGIQKGAARALLIHFRWSTERLFAAIADTGEERVFQAAGVPQRDDSQNAAESLESDEMTCGICFSQVEVSDSTMMDCGHRYCNDCWAQHLIIRIKDGQSRRLTCMAERCSAVCDEDKVRTLVSAVDPSTASRFDRSLLESFIEDNAAVKWCPSVPSCTNAIAVAADVISSDLVSEVECICSHQFCFACLAAPHSPASCAIWQLWEQKCRDESETVHWLQANTKCCPKCSKSVEKSGGCNLVQCICGQCFCWLCGAATGRAHTWNTIEGHTCGRYKEEKEKNAETAQRDLKRYIHYHDRWQGHVDSLKWEKNRRDNVASKIAAMEEADQQLLQDQQLMWLVADKSCSSSSRKQQPQQQKQPRDYLWLTTGLDRLFRTRRALAYSYVFAYYMFGNWLFKEDVSKEQNEINQNLFEDQQQQLEQAVEKLSLLVETNVELAVEEEEEYQQMRMAVVNQTLLLDTFCRRMYDVIENELLGSLASSSHHIAPYRSQGCIRAAAAEERK